MGGRGSAYDKAVGGAFFKTLRSELVDRHSWPTRAELSTAVFDYIDLGGDPGIPASPRCPCATTAAIEVKEIQ